MTLLVIHVSSHGSIVNGDLLLTILTAFYLKRSFFFVRLLWSVTYHLPRKPFLLFPAVTWLEILPFL